MPVFYFSPFFFFFSSLFLAFLIVFVLIFSGWSCLFVSPLSPLCGCLFCLCLFFHRELSLSSFLICLFQASFVLPGSPALCTLMSTLTADFGPCGGKEGGRCGKTALQGPRERILGGEGARGRGGEVVSCYAIHSLQTYFSVPGQKSDTFSHRSSGFLDLPWLQSLSLPSLFFYPIAVELSFPLPNFLLSGFLWNMFYLLLLFSNIALMRNTHLEVELFLKRGRSLLIIAIRIIVEYEVPMLTQGQKQDSRNLWPCSIGHRFLIESRESRG